MKELAYIQYNGNNIDEIIDFVELGGGCITAVEITTNCTPPTYEYYLSTFDGDVLIEVGDWVGVSSTLKENDL